MSINISSPYASGTITAIPDSNKITVSGNPSSSWVTRCIRFTDGASDVRGNTFRIVAVSGNTLTLEFDLDVSSFDSIGISNGIPAIGVNFVVSYFLNDLADGTNVIKYNSYSYALGLSSASKVTLSNSVFIYDVNKNIIVNGDYLDCRGTSITNRPCWRFGNIDADGNTYNGCTIINKVVRGSGSIQGWNLGADFHCDWHMYGGEYKVEDNNNPLGGSVFDYIFADDPVYRRYNVFVNGSFGGRLGLGTRSVVAKTVQYGSTSEFAILNPAGQGGKLFDLEVQNSTQLLYHFWGLSESQFVSGLKFDNKIERLVYFNQSGAGVHTLELNDLDMAKVKALAVCLNTNVSNSNPTFRLSNNASINLFDKDSILITDQAKFIIKNNSETVVLEENETGLIPDTKVAYSRNSMNFAGDRSYANLPSLVEYGPYKAAVASYNYIAGVKDTTLDQSENISFTSLNDESVTEKNKSIVATYSKCENLDELYDLAKLYFYNNFEAMTPLGVQPVSIVDGVIDFGAYDIVIDDALIEVFSIDGSVASIKSSSIVNGSIVTALKTTGIITGKGKLNIDRVTDESGTEVAIKVLNLEAGDRVQIYDTTNNLELYNDIVEGAVLSFGIYHTADINLRIRVACISCLSKEYTAVLTVSGATVSHDQEIDAVYIDNGIDGSAVTEFTADLPNVEVDVNDPDNVTTPQRLYAWTKFFQQDDPIGISGFFQGIFAEDSVNYRVASGILLTIDNRKTEPLRVVSGRIYREDGETIISATSNSIQIDPDKAYLAKSEIIISGIEDLKLKTDDTAAIMLGK